MILRFESIEPLSRGDGIVTRPLVTKRSVDQPGFTTGISTYPAGTGAPRHSHNCDEQVTLLSGVGEVEVEGVITLLRTHDTTYIRNGEVHAFRNAGHEPMTILWIYSSADVTRTLIESGRTVEHLSIDDVFGAE
jgi:quercetin dioxygenase-like cupin family protein